MAIHSGNSVPGQVGESEEWNKMNELRSAWLVTWESAIVGRVSQDKKVVAVFNYRWGGRKVRELVEQLYVSLEYCPSDKLRVARDGRDRVYPAEFSRIGDVPWDGEIICGHDPFLRARRVRKLRLVETDMENTRLQWDEVQRPNPIGQ